MKNNPAHPDFPILLEPLFGGLPLADPDECRPEGSSGQGEYDDVSFTSSPE